MLMTSEFEETIKHSFKRVKGHIEALEAEIRANREFIISQNTQVEAQNARILELLGEISAIKREKKELFSEKGDKKELNLNKLSLKNEVSRGSSGVHSFIHSFNSHSFTGPSLDIHSFKERLPLVLSRVTKKEFLTFLAVYNQEEQFGKVTYETVAKELGLSTGCVRSYVSNLLRKGLPVVKTRFNNKIIVLSIPAEIRGLNMKKSLIQVFYDLDPHQTTFGEPF